MMNNQVSLLNKKISQAQPDKKSRFKVYIEDQEGNSFSTKLTSEVNTIYEAIVQAVRNFNHNIHTKLPESPDFYELYAAKNGKRDTGLPSFQKTQSIHKVGKQKFFLVSLSKDVRLTSIQSVSSIKTISIEIGSQNSKKIETIKQKDSFCLCGSW